MRREEENMIQVELVVRQELEGQRNSSEVDHILKSQGFDPQWHFQEGLATTLQGQTLVTLGNMAP